MAHYANIDDNNRVTRVIVAEQWFIDQNLAGPKTWIQTSYNTRGGVHYGPDGLPDGGVQLRFNFAGIGDIYDPELDAFYTESPGPEYQLNTTTCLWEIK